MCLIDENCFDPRLKPLPGARVWCNELKKFVAFININLIKN